MYLEEINQVLQEENVNTGNAIPDQGLSKSHLENEEKEIFIKKRESEVSVSEDKEEKQGASMLIHRNVEDNLESEQQRERGGSENRSNPGSKQDLGNKKTKFLINLSDDIGGQRKKHDKTD